MNLLIKFVGIPVIVIVAGYLLQGIDFANVYQPIIVGLTIGAVGYFLEFLIVRKGLLWAGIAIDFIAAVFIFYSISNMLPGARVTFLNVVLIAIVLMIVEYFVHRHLITNDKVTNSYA